jgi:S1-C subfamily serine protease
MRRLASVNRSTRNPTANEVVGRGWPAETADERLPELFVAREVERPPLRATIKTTAMVMATTAPAAVVLPSRDGSVAPVSVWEARDWSCRLSGGQRGGGTDDPALLENSH